MCCCCNNSLTISRLKVHIQLYSKRVKVEKPIWMVCVRSIRGLIWGGVVDDGVDGGVVVVVVVDNDDDNDDDDNDDDNDGGVENKISLTPSALPSNIWTRNNCLVNLSWSIMALLSNKQ